MDAEAAIVAALRIRLEELEADLAAVGGDHEPTRPPVDPAIHQHLAEIGLDLT